LLVDVPSSYLNMSELVILNVESQGVVTLLDHVDARECAELSLIGRWSMYLHERSDVRLIRAVAQLS